MRRAPAGIAATDFNGKGNPCENGRTESWKVPRVALPTQPGAAGGSSAKAIPTAIAITIEIRVTRLWTLWQGKKSGSDS